MRLGLAVCLAMSMAAGSDEIDALEARYGHDPIAATIGNGGLTVAVDDRGRVSALRWPSPGYHDQLTYRSGEDATGLTWGLVRGGRTYWSGAWRWSGLARESQGRLLQTFENPQLGVSGTSIWTVDRDTDRFEWRLSFDGTTSDDRIVWYCGFTPTTRSLPELPVADFLLDPLNGFAAYVDPGLDGVVHFRPAQPGQNEWVRLEQLARAGEPPATMRFGSGVWIVCRAGGDAAYRAIDTSAINTRNLTMDGPPSLMAVGPNAAGVAIAPLTGGTAVLTACFGETSTDARDLALGDREFTAFEPASDPLLDTIRIHQDRATGSVVRSASVRPPLNRDWPRYGAWSIRALDLAGAHDRARGLLAFYLERLSRGTDLPAGALPHAMYADGAPAALRGLVDTEGAAWVIWAAGEHAKAVGADERAAFLDAHWDDLAALTGFVVDWAEDTTGTPWHAYDPGLGRDRRSRAQVFTGHLALTVMTALADSGQRAVPESWIRRKNQWDARLAGYSRLPGFRFEDEPLPFWAREAFPPDHPAVTAAIEARRGTDAGRSPAQAARDLAEQALYFEQDPGERVAIGARGRALAAGPDTGTRFDTDSYAAAVLYVATHFPTNRGENPR